MANESHSDLFKKLSGAFDKAAEKPVEFSTFGELPAGINGGTAVLAECRLGVYKSGANEGKPHLYLAGIVESPDSHGDSRIRGLRTSLTMPLCPTSYRNGDSRTVEENVGRASNELKKLLGDGYDPGCLSGSRIEATMQALVQAAPRFKFRTWKRDDSEFINHSWEGLLPTSVLDNGQAPSPVTEEPLPANPPARGAKGKAAPSASPEPSSAPAPTSEPFDEFADLDSLAERATAEEEDAQDRLRELALQAGYTDEDVDDADNWSDVAWMARNPRTAEGGAPKEGKDTDGWKPAREEVYLFKATPRSKKPLEVEVVAVDAKAGTVDIKALDDPEKTWENIPWDRLIRE